MTSSRQVILCCRSHAVFWKHRAFLAVFRNQPKVLYGISLHVIVLGFYGFLAQNIFIAYIKNFLHVCFKKHLQFEHVIGVLFQSFQYSSIWSYAENWYSCAATSFKRDQLKKKIYVPTLFCTLQRYSHRQKWASLSPGVFGSLFKVLVWLFALIEIKVVRPDNDFGHLT